MNKNISVIIPRMNGKRLAVIAKAIQLAKEGNRVAIYDTDGKIITFEPNKPEEGKMNQK